MKLKTTSKATRAAWYSLSNIPPKYAVEIENRFNDSDLADRMSEELWSEIRDIIKDVAHKNIPNNKTSKKRNG